MLVDELISRLKVYAKTYAIAGIIKIARMIKIISRPWIGSLPLAKPIRFLEHIRHFVVFGLQTDLVNTCSVVFIGEHRVTIL